MAERSDLEQGARSKRSKGSYKRGPIDRNPAGILAVTTGSIVVFRGGVNLSLFVATVWNEQQEVNFSVCLISRSPGSVTGCLLARASDSWWPHDFVRWGTSFDFIRRFPGRYQASSSSGDYLRYVGTRNSFRAALDERQTWTRYARFGSDSFPVVLIRL